MTNCPSSRFGIRKRRSSRISTSRIYSGKNRRRINDPNYCLSFWRIDSGVMYMGGGIPLNIKEYKAGIILCVSRQYDKVHEKREEIVDRIKNITRETTQFKAKMQKLRDSCNQNTEKAQVRISPSCSVRRSATLHLKQLWTFFFSVQKLFVHQ